MISLEQTKAFAKQAVDVLNRALEADPVCLNQLLNTRIRCNKALVDDPTIQVAAKDDHFTLGPIGLINGIVGIDERSWGFVAAEYELECPQDGKLNNVPEAEGKKVGDECPLAHCKETIVLGQIERFRLLTGEERE